MNAKKKTKHNGYNRAKNTRSVKNRAGHAPTPTHAQQLKHATHASVVDSDDVDAALRPTAHERAGGVSRPFAIIMLLASIAGIYASVSLLVEEQVKKANPFAPLECDINPLIGCGSSLMSWQAHLLFGLPNALLGSVAFGVLLLLGLWLLFGKTLPRWFWWLMCAGTVVGMCMIVFFVYHSIFSFDTLCPFCMIVWVVTVALFVMFLSRTIKATTSLGVPITGVRRVIIREWPLLLLGLYAILLLILVIGKHDKIALLF